MNVLKMVAVLVAAIMIGNWFLDEVRKSRIRKEPWYRPYLSIPGLLILVMLTIPVVVYMVQG